MTFNSHLRRQCRRKYILSDKAGYKLYGVQKRVWNHFPFDYIGQRFSIKDLDSFEECSIIEKCIQVVFATFFVVFTLLHPFRFF